MITGYAALFIFMLAAFTGYEVIGRVPAILHTPLMSGSNFVHGVVVVGALVALGSAHTTSQRIIGFVAVLLGTANAVGGYAVTERMLDMFTAGGPRKPGGAAKPGGATEPDGSPRPTGAVPGDSQAGVTGGATVVTVDHERVSDVAAVADSAAVVRPPADAPDAAAFSDRQKADNDA